ncbi:6-phospho-beta-glucosidase [Dactylosporangium sp. CA-233914]|uniref:family 4 glycosyl hydrolase n=1 Tax=Dactylosporangium sp. CA-233914 TaxID=3239934 RepID=UPI003D8F3D56
MRLAILGGGGFRVPLIYRALLGDPVIGDVVLHDRDPGRLAAIRRVLAAQAERAPAAPAVTATTDLDEALAGADFVFSAIRVHGLAGRVLDERIAIAEGVLGQETVGAGGISYGLRTVPVVTALARRIAAIAPQAWVVNFTNPAGLVTEAMAGHLGERVIGICDSPAGLCREVAHALGADPDTLDFDYAGLNHLGWLRHVYRDGTDLLRGEPVPNEYLHYYEHPSVPTGPTRGEFLQQQQQELYRLLLDEARDPLSTWDGVRAERDATYMAEARDGERDQTVAGGYEDVALALMRALAGRGEARLILNVRNRGTLPHLDPDAVVEVPCRVDSGGAHPLPVSPLDPGAAALTAAVKASEREVLRAAATGSADAALRAFAAHPLVGSPAIARRLLDGYRRAFPELEYLH